MVCLLDFCWRKEVDIAGNDHSHRGAPVACSLL
jgi:hypothetical protein